MESSAGIVVHCAPSFPPLISTKLKTHRVQVFTMFHVMLFRLDILCIILIIQLVIGFNANFPDLPIDTHIKYRFVADTDVYIRCY